MTLAEKIRQVREEKHLTQKAVAASMGISQQAYGQYESGGRLPKPETLGRIAAALGCDVADLDETLAITPDEILSGLLDIANRDETNRKRMNAAYSKLNPEGRAKAAERVEELTEIARYQLDTDAPQDAPAGPDDKEPAEK